MTKKETTRGHPWGLHVQPCPPTSPAPCANERDPHEAAAEGSWGAPGQAGAIWGPLGAWSSQGPYQNPQTSLPGDGLPMAPGAAPFGKDASSQLVTSCLSILKSNPHQSRQGPARCLPCSAAAILTPAHSVTTDSNIPVLAWSHPLEHSFPVSRGFVQSIPLCPAMSPVPGQCSVMEE